MSFAFSPILPLFEPLSLTMAFAVQFDELVVSQLEQLGYDRVDCLEASKAVNDPSDINAVRDKVSEIVDARAEEEAQQEQATNTQINGILDELYNVGSMRRDKAISLLRKILSKIVDNPNEEKFQSLNHQKIKAKFVGLQCPFMVDLLLVAGFSVIDDRLVLKENNVELILRSLSEKEQAEEERLKEERLRVIRQNQQRLNTKENQKKKETKEQILTQHQEQMVLASQGVYNVKASVADRKGTGKGVNSLKYD